MAYATPVKSEFTSIFGKSFGVDRLAPQRPYAPNDYRHPVTFLTTLTTNVTNNGIAIASSGACTWTVDAPAVGVRKRLFATSTSTLVRTFTLASGTIEVGPSVGGGSGTVTASSAATSIVLNGQGQAVELVGLSTARFAVISIQGFSTGATIFS